MGAQARGLQKHSFGHATRPGDSRWPLSGFGFSWFFILIFLHVVSNEDLKGWCLQILISWDILILIIREGDYFFIFYIIIDTLKKLLMKRFKHAQK